MKNKTDHLEDFFQSAFNDAEQLEQAAAWNEPSDAVWGNIQEGLREERRFSLVALRWPWSAIAASYLLLMSGYQFFQNKSENVAIETVAIVGKSALGTSNHCEYVSCIDDFSRRESSTKNIVQRRLKSSVREAQSLAVKVNELVVDNAENQIVGITGYPPFFQEKRSTLPIMIPIKKDFLDKENSMPLTPDFNLPPVKKAKTYVAASYAPVVEQLTNKSTKNTSTQRTNGQSFGVNIGKTNAKGWTLETGLQYTKMEEQLVQTEGATEQQIPSATYLDIPLTVKKSWTKKRTQLAVKTGLVNRFELNQMVAANQGVTEEIPTLATKKYMPMVTAGVELAYAVNAKLSVYVAPTMAKSLTPIIDVEGMELTAENLMVQVGIRYEL